MRLTYDKYSGYTDPWTSKWIKQTQDTTCAMLTSLRNVGMYAASVSAVLGEWSTAELILTFPPETA